MKICGIEVTSGINFLDKLSVYVATPEDAGNPPDEAYFLLVNPKKLTAKKSCDTPLQVVNYYTDKGGMFLLSKKEIKGRYTPSMSSKGAFIAQLIFAAKITKGLPKELRDQYDKIMKDVETCAACGVPIFTGPWDDDYDT